KAVNAQGKAELETLARGVTDAKGDANEERENEAMRVANIVKAEVSAAKVKRQLETLKNSNNKADKDEYNRLIQNPAEIARMFWNEMRPPDKRIPPREGTKHQTNTYRMPESSIYGGYDFTHVLKTLGNGVTHEILMHQTPVRDEYQPGPNQKLR
ncbi:MAG: hypothetical protein NTY98_03395, partial [Verrucomicrobia bacterium]|nr:hypothetical protein [Verrucomicrobiota bacterium]